MWESQRICCPCMLTSSAGMPDSAVRLHQSFGTHAQAFNEFVISPPLDPHVNALSTHETALTVFCS